MIDRRDRCIDVLPQVAATRAALTAVGRGLLDCEIRLAIQAGGKARQPTHPARANQTFSPGRTPRQVTMNATPAPGVR